MLLASVLSATDPDTVVAAQGAIGAPQKLSKLVDGESLVNDGSGVVAMKVFGDWVVGSKHHRLNGIARLLYNPLTASCNSSHRSQAAAL